MAQFTPFLPVEGRFTCWRPAVVRQNFARWRILYWDDIAVGEVGESYVAGARIYLAPATGGTPRNIQQNFADARYPNWAGDGQHIFFEGTKITQSTLVETADWWVADLSQPEHPVATKTGAWDMLRQQSIPAFQSAQWWHNSIIFPGRVTDSISLFRICLSDSRRAIGRPERLAVSARTAVDPSISQDGTMFFYQLDLNRECLVATPGLLDSGSGLGKRSTTPDRC